MTLNLLALAEPQLPKLAPSDSFWLPVDASVTTRNIDWVWEFLVWMSVLTALAIFVAMFHFVTKYKAQQGVVTLPSGIMYRIAKPGTGAKVTQASQVQIALRSFLAAVGVPLPFSPTAYATDAPSAQAPAESARDVSQYNLGKKGLALEGYDPVAYFPEGGGAPRRGKAEFELAWRSVTYRFATKENLDRFKADPVRYEPAHGGWCSTAMADGGRKVEVSPRNFRVTDGRLFLFYKDMFSDAQDDWKKDEAGNTRKADEQWKRLSGEDPRTPPR